MSQNTIVKTIPSQTSLTLNIRNINQLFPDFAAGYFVLLHGSHAVTFLASLLCIRAQFPPQLGGLGNNVVFIDGANTFRLYQITRLARLQQLAPKQVLDSIYISRAFTVYQMAPLMLQKIEDVVKAYNAKLMIISDIAAMFLNKDVRKEEAKRIYSQVTTHISTFNREQQAITIATYPPHEDSRRNIYLKALTSGRANVVITLKQTKHERQVIIEKHHTFTTGFAELPTEILLLTAFMEA